MWGFEPRTLLVSTIRLTHIKPINNIVVIYLAPQNNYAKPQQRQTSKSIPTDQDPSKNLQQQSPEFFANVGYGRSQAAIL